MVALQLALLLSAPAGLLAFKDTYPLAGWSSIASTSLESIAPSSQLSLNSANPVLSYEGLCEYDAIVVVEQPGLHASDLKALPSSSTLAKSMNSAASSFHIPYLQTPNPVGFAQEVAKLCNRDALQVGVNSELSGDKLADKQVVSIDLPELHCMGKYRKTQMLDLDAALSQKLKKLTERYSSHLVIVAGTQSSSFSPVKRQLSELQRALPPAFASSPSPSAAKPKKSTKGGLFARYQFLTPGLITSFGITFLLITPLILMVVNAVASIKSPVRSDNVKQVQEKKNQ